jgi:hypothetical protein
VKGILFQLDHTFPNDRFQSGSGITHIFLRGVYKTPVFQKSVPNCWPDKSRYPAYKLKARNNIAHNGCLLFLAFVVLNLNYYIL